jgi:WD40 repeat protein
LKNVSEDALITSHEVLIFAGDDGTVRVVFVPKDLSYATHSSMALIEHIVLRAGRKRITTVTAQVSSDHSTVWIWAGTQSGRLHRWDLQVGGAHASGLTPKSTSPTTSIEAQRGVIPWSIQIYKTQPIPGQFTSTEPHSLILGDADGNISIFDGAMGVLTQTLSHHKADILRVVLTPSTGSFFSVGVDNTISLFQRASNTSALANTASSTTTQHAQTHGSSGSNAHESNGMDVDEQSAQSLDSTPAASTIQSSHHAPWVFVNQRRSHTHDILAAVAGADRLYTGGIDTKLIVHEYSDLLKLPGRAFLPFPQNGSLVASLVSGAQGKKDRMVVQLENRLQLWRLGKPLKNGVIDPKTNHHDILEDQTLLLDITPKVSGRIQCHASSPSAHRIAFSDNINTKVFCIRERGSGLASGKQQDAETNEDQFFAAFSDPVLNVEKKLTIKGPSSRLQFTPNGTLVRATPNTHLIQTWDVSDADRPSLLHTFQEHSVKPKASHTNNTSGLNHGAEGSFGSGSSSPQPINFITVSPCGKYLASSDLHNRVFIFSLETNQLVFALPVFEEHITALAFDPEEQHLAVALSSNRFWIYHIESKSITEWSRTHSNDLPSKLTDEQERIIGLVFHPSVPGMLFAFGHSFIFYAQTAGSGNRLWKLFKAYQPLFVDFVDDEALVVVERPWLKVLQFLPPPFYRQRFGT